METDLDFPICIVSIFLSDLYICLSELELLTKLWMQVLQNNFSVCKWSESSVLLYICDCYLNKKNVEVLVGDYTISEWWWVRKLGGSSFPWESSCMRIFLVKAWLNNFHHKWVEMGFVLHLESEYRPLNIKKKISSEVGCAFNWWGLCNPIQLQFLRSIDGIISWVCFICLNVGCITFSMWRFGHPLPTINAQVWKVHLFWIEVFVSWSHNSRENATISRIWH